MGLLVGKVEISVLGWFQDLYTNQTTDKPATPNFTKAFANQDEAQQ